MLRDEASNVCAISRSNNSIADAAVAALLAELELYPKPGLVSPVDSGAHRDMDYALMRRSAESLKNSFAELASAGRRGAGFQSELIPIGIKAEAKMLAATSGVNTHRGAIFLVGLLAAASARCTNEWSANNVRHELMTTWGIELQRHNENGDNCRSHGGHVRRRNGVGGARYEASLGFPTVFELALPTYQMLIKKGYLVKLAAIQTLFTLIAHLDDTNILFRTGHAGATFARRSATNFLAVGGVDHPDWEQSASVIHQSFIARNLSPGGTADILAATFFLHCLSVRPQEEA